MAKFLLALFFASSLSAADLNDRIRIEKVHGNLKSFKVQRTAGGKEEQVSVGDVLYVGETVNTEPGQVVELSAFDGSAWAVAPGTKLKLESRKADAKSLYHWTFNLVRGSMWGEVPKKEGAPKDNFRLKTKAKFASMGIRGTEYLMGGTDKLTTVDVLEGTVWFGKNPEFPAGSYKEVRAGQHAEMGSDGKITVHSSNGDKGVLAKKYGVVPGYVESEQPEEGTLEECKAKGKGWRSTEGGKKNGICFEKGE